jgi:hypothetical protein
MFEATRKTLATLGVMAAAAAGGAAYAGAAGDSSSGSGDDRSRRSSEQALTGATAGKVEAAALARVDGGTILRVETDADHGSPYEAHVRRSDGTEVEVLVNEQFEVTAVNEMRAGGPGGRGPHGPGMHRQELGTLARELGVSQAKLRAALNEVGAGDRPGKGTLAADLAKALGVDQSAVEEILEANRPDGPRGPGGRGHGDLIEALASGLDVDEAKVEAALEELHETRHADLAAALARELGLDADDVADALDSFRPGPPPRP